MNGSAAFQNFLVADERHGGGVAPVLAAPITVQQQVHRPEACTCGDAGVGLLTTSGVEPNIGDALCIGSATLFGVHKWRSETVTARFSDSTNELIAVQLLALASAAAGLLGATGLPPCGAGARWAPLCYLSEVDPCNNGQCCVTTDIKIRDSVPSILCIYQP